MKTQKKMTKERFRAMCKQHDLTYAYSDDHRVWRRGCDTLMQILAAAKELPEGVASRIWNESVDEKIKEPYRGKYYWDY